MIVVSSSGVTGKKITATLGLVRGNTIRAKWFGKDIVVGLRQIVGGELNEYTEIYREQRN